MTVVAYTAIFGGYDTLRPIDWPGTCFTDGKVVPVAHWHCKIGVTDWPPKLASRYYKILVHEHVDSEYSVYIDGNRTLFADPVEIVERWLRDTDIAVFRHPEQRDCIYQEADEVLRQHKACPRQVHEQMARYRREGYPAHNGLATCCIIARRHTDRVREFNELWWHKYVNGVRRDQLSFNYVCWQLGIKYTEMPEKLLKVTNRTPHPHCTPRPEWLADGELPTPEERRWLAEIISQWECPIISGMGIDSGECTTTGQDKAHIIIISSYAACQMDSSELDTQAARIIPGGVLVIRGYAPSPRQLSLVPEMAGARLTIDQWHNHNHEKWYRLNTPGGMIAFQKRAI